MAKNQTRSEVRRAIEQALELAQPVVRASIEGAEAVELKFIERWDIPNILATWDDEPVLNWKQAIRKCRKTSRSGFIGLQVGEATWALALIRLSQGHVYTNLLYLEKNPGGMVPRGLVMTAIDYVLRAIAVTFKSRAIVLDSPISDLVAYYQQFGFVPIKRGHRKNPVMIKAV